MVEKLFSTVSGPLLSIVVPVCNEAENVGPLAEEIRDALQDQGLFELIFVDDGSTDATACAVVEARAGVPQIRLLRHLRRCGQSAAICTGIRAAQGAWVATLDGDGQNDPADIPTLLRVRSEQARPNLKLIMGNRKTRRDTWIRRISSRVANGVRSRMLNDGTPDTGCGLKLFERIVFMELPHFDHMHRFLPALFQRAGAEIMSVPVRHRARTRGMSKYGLHNRLWVGIVDLFGMRWLIRRALPGHSIIEE